MQDAQKTTTAEGPLHVFVVCVIGQDVLDHEFLVLASGTKDVSKFCAHLQLATYLVGHPRCKIDVARRNFPILKNSLDHVVVA